MKHFASRRFWQSFNDLPPKVQARAKSSYALLKENPRHPSLHFKQTHKSDLWTVRIDKRYRALGVDVGESIQWFWIGSHANYDKIIREK